MRRFVVPDLDLEADLITLPSRISDHLHKVLRLGPGDPLLLVVGRGISAECVIDRIRGGDTIVRVLRRYVAAVRKIPPLHLVQGLTKGGGKMDEIIRRATELGVTAIHPALCHRSVARPDETRAAKRVERWERIAAEASRQCGRDELPRILAPALLDEVLRRCASEMHGILLWEGEDSTSLSSCLSHFDTNRGVTLVIGPEGGLTDDEVGRARGLGYHTASMGPLILRTETAAIAACALVQHFLGGLEPTEQASEA